jgi:hypothetical protein
MPRSKLNDTEKKTGRLTVRFRPKEMTDLAEQAESCGLSMAEFVRRRATRKRVTPATDLKMIAELRRIGGLIKHFFNETNGLYRHKTAELLDELRAAVVRLGRNREMENQEDDG